MTSWPLVHFSGLTVFNVSFDVVVSNETRVHVMVVSKFKDCTVTHPLVVTNLLKLSEIRPRPFDPKLCSQLFVYNGKYVHCGCNL